MPFTPGYVPWNKGRCIGQKRPFKITEVEVIPKVLVDTIARSGMNLISWTEINAGRSNYHPDLLAALRAAALDVANKVDSEPRRCDYWHRNPEAVAEIRNEAQLSIR